MKRRFLVKTAQLVGLGLAIYFLPKFCASQTDGFTTLKIASTLSFDPRWGNEPPPQELKSWLEQPFTYIGSGGQCYAFASQDGRLVIKFFKHHLRRVPWITDHLPLPSRYALLRERQREKRNRKLLRDFNSYLLAFHYLKEESGLVYIHLNKSEQLKQKVILIDRLGIRHSIDLDQHEFVVQKRGELALPHLHKLLKSSEASEAKEAIDSILSLLVSRCQKGIYDEDPRIHCNLGFLSSKAFLIDVGRLRLDDSRKDPSVYKQDIRLITERLKQVLEKESPSLANYLEERLLAL